MPRSGQVRSGRQRRTQRARPLSQRILVVTEGAKTEPAYIERLDAYLRTQGITSVVKRVGVGKDPLKVVQRAVELRKQAAHDKIAYDYAFCLVDVDEHASLPDACALANREGILLIVSNLKFEMWLRWHGEESRSPMASKQLDKHVSRMGFIREKALLPNFPIERFEQACRVARMADPQMDYCTSGPDPSSAMPLLVDVLAGKDSYS